jgi:5-deoxy-D-glucuronate isomerase
LAGERASEGVERGKNGIRWLGLDVVRLAAGETWKTKLAEEEAALVVMSGKCSVRVGQETFEGVGGRADMLPDRLRGVRAAPSEIESRRRPPRWRSPVPCDQDRP